MSQVFLWFWYLVLLWSFTSFGSSRVVLGAEVSSSDDSERRLSSTIADFLIGSNREEKKISTLDPVTVIASRLPSFRTRLSDIPSNVSYFPANVSYKSHEELMRSSARTFQESVQDLEGGIFFDQVGNGLDTTFGLRGFSEGSEVVVLVDGVRVNELDGAAVNYPLIPTYDIETVQIERGSASPIYGSGAFAGIVHVTSRRPSQKRINLFGGSEVSSFKGIKFYQGASGTLPDLLTSLGGAFTYYFNMGRDLNQGFRSNGEWRITSLDAKVGYQLPDDDGSLEVGVKHIQDAISNPGTLTIPEFYADEGQSKNLLDGRDFRNTIIHVSADKKFLDQRLVASFLTSWRMNWIHFYTTSRTFIDGSFNPDTDLVTVRSRTTDLVWQLGYREQWKAVESETHAGMEFRDASEHDIEQDAFRGNVVETSPRETERTSKPEFFGLFWREQLKFFERIIAHAGMRHDWHTLKTDDQLNSANDLSRRWRKSTFSTGLTIKPFKFLDLFGNYSQGFRVPTISEVAPFSSGISTALNPEKTDSYEVGGRFRHRDSILGKTSLFLIDTKDEILFDSTSITTTTPFGQNVNAGKSRRVGLETRLDVVPIKELDFYGSYTWVKAYIRETGGSGVPFDGKDLGLVPRHRMTFGAEAKPLVRYGTPWDGLLFRFDSRYTGRQFIQSHESASQASLNAAGETIDPYLIFDFMTSFEWKGKRIYFKINNLFNRIYYSRAVAATAFAGFNPSITPAGTHLFVNPGAPREYLVGMTWEFGA